MVDHSTRKHALLSASGASRWMNCTPSMRMEESLNLVEESSVFAEEGTLAHEFADLFLRHFYLSKELMDDDTFKKYYVDLDLLRANKHYTDDMEGFVVVYVDYVIAQYNIEKRKTKDAELLIEAKTDFSHLVPEGFGTSDANIVAAELLEIVDLKYGSGIKVSAIKNPQTRLYALGILREMSMMYDIKEVKMTIVQPRLDHIESETLTVEELEAWAENEVKPAAKKAFEGSGDCKTGTWCRFCKAKPVCKALADQNIALAKHEFADPKILSDEALLEVYEQAKPLVEWSKAVNTYLLREAMGGKAFKGYKLVRGRASRKITDEEQAIKVLAAAGFPDVVNSKIKGLGDLEKMVGKADFKAMDLTTTPPGKLTFVKSTDKRAGLGIESAKKDFK
jgi:hypothetical protein